MPTPACPVCDVDQPPAQAEPMVAPRSTIDRDTLPVPPGTQEAATPRPSTLNQASPAADDHPEARPRTTGDTHTLCAAIARGNRDAFALFYEAWFDRCYAMARSLTRRDEAFCLDVVQNAMLRVARSIRAMRSELGLSRWMVRTVHSSAIDMLRSEARARRRDRAAARSEVARPDELVESRAHEWLASALASLDEQERDMLRLRFIHGATLDAVGQAVGATGDAAHGRVRRVLTRLRRSADPP